MTLSFLGYWFVASIACAVVCGLASMVCDWIEDRRQQRFFAAHDQPRGLTDEQARKVFNALQGMTSRRIQ